MREVTVEGAVFRAALTRDRRGSDALHWGEGTISLTRMQIVREGRLAPARMTSSAC